MKDKECSTKECKNPISSGMNKSGLCGECYMKKWRIENKKEIAVYRKEHWRRFPEKHEKAKRMQNDWWKKFSKENPEKISEIHSKLYKENTKYYKGHSKKYYEENKEHIAKRHLDYANTRYKLDEGYKTRKQLGSALSMVIRVYIKIGKIRNPMKKFSIDWEGIVNALSPIPKNRSDYQIDHIIPLFKFDLTDIEQVHLAFAPENHRWLLTKENQRRSRA